MSTSNKIIEIEIDKNGKYRRVVPGGGKPFIKESEYKKIQKDNQKILDKQKDDIKKKNEKIESETKKDNDRYKRESKESADKVAKRIAEIQSKTPTKKININLKKVNDFANNIDSESEDVSQKHLMVFDMYSQLIKENATRVLANRFLRLANKYDKINKKYYELYVKVFKIGIVTETDEVTYDGLIKRTDEYGKEFEALLIENDTLQNLIIQKEKEKSKKESERNKKKSLGEKRISKKRNEADLKKDQIEKDKTSKRKLETRERRLEAVRSGRERQEQEKNQESLEKKKQHLQGRREKSDKFFSTNLEDKGLLIRGAAGVGKGLGKVIGAPLNAFGFDFQDEKQFLSTLFSPLVALGKFGLGKAKSITQKYDGIDDASIESLDDIHSISSDGKKKVDQGKLAQKLQPSKDKGIKGAFKSIGKMFGGSNSKSFLNNSSKVNNTSNVNNSTIRQSNQDYNRTDDHDGEVTLEPTNDILNKILKTLKGEHSDNSKSSSLVSKGKGFLDFITKVGPTALATGGLSYLLYKITHFGSGDNNSTSNTSSNVTNTDGSNNTLQQKVLKDQNIFNQKHPSLSKIQDLLGGGDDSVNVNNVVSKSVSNMFAQGDSLKTKYGLKGTPISSNLFRSDTDSIPANDPTRLHSPPSFFQSDSNKTAIKAEVKKIEKIKDDQENNKDLAEDMKKFLLDEFISKFAEKFATLFINNSGTGKSFMPSVKPF